MKYNEAQAEGKAQQIFKRFGLLIHLACANSIVPEDFLAGFIGVEAGIDHSGQIRPEATRFENGVYHKLLAVRDGLRSSWSNITTRDLTGLSDDAVRNLATSWGLTQIMGWHLIHNLKGTIQDLRDTDKHLHYTVQLLIVTAGSYIQNKRFDSVLRIWNTGSANGKTYDDDYVGNASLVRKHYAAIVAANKDAVSSEQSAVSGQDSAVEPPAVSQPVDTTPSASAADPAVDLSSQAPPPSEWEAMKAKLEAVVDKFDRFNDVATGVKTRTDSAKSLWSTIGSTVFQVAWAVVGFIVGLPREVWIVVAILAAAFGLYYLHRQISLGKIREQAKSPAPQPQNVTATSEVSVS